MKLARSIGAAAAAVLLALTMTACGSDSDDSSGTNGQPAAPSNDGSNAGASGGGGDSDRAFGLDRDQMLGPIESATGGDASWEGNDLVVTYSEGSVEDPSASLDCLAVEIGISEEEGESAVLRYSDGDLRCEDR